VKWPTLLAVLIGLGLAVTLLVSNDIGQIVGAVAGAGWGLLLVIALRVPQTVASAMGWRKLVPETGTPLWAYVLLRWIREGVNALLPVAGVGGDMVRARLLALTGIPLKSAAASSGVDLSLEMASQIVFSLVGVGMLLALQPGVNSTGLILGVIAGGALIAGSFMAAQRYGLFRHVERLLVRISEREGWSALGDITGLHEQVVSLYRTPNRLWISGAWHLASWFLGVLEIWAALYVLGVPVELQEALVIESLGQAVKGIGFAIPGALGVQEGGLILVCGLFGIAPPEALALSLVRRLRDIVHGLPALAIWHRIEGQRYAERAEYSEDGR
jgi:putative membrane protein